MERAVQDTLAPLVPALVAVLVSLAAYLNSRSGKQIATTVESVQAEFAAYRVKMEARLAFLEAEALESARRCLICEAAQRENEVRYQEALRRIAFLEGQAQR